MMAWLFVSASMISFSPADWPAHGRAPLHPPSETLNWGRQVGAWLSYELFSMLGIGAWILLAAAALHLLLAARRIRVTHTAVRAIGVLMLALALSALHALFLPAATSFPEGSGGLV
ncbi:MAG: DNA translocase FtsK 4TM domain-containing protein, partial [Phycisphaerales bacterium]|nr:DNA translocase FtsK 4TM domain-containing protein [Phycisphaerales bacterium]